VDRRYDIAIALAVIALGVFVIAVAKTIPMGYYKDAVGPRAFFFGIGVLFLVGGGVVGMERLRYWKAQKGHTIPSEGTADEEDHPVSPLRAASVIGISIGYVALMNPLGYLLSTPLYITGALVMLGVRKWGWIILLAVGFTVVFYIVFAQMLNIRIPVGPFTRLFRDLGWIIF
jgi:putative tricarboxylic transport membrane protein